MADLEGMHGYLGLQQLDQRTDWAMVEGKSVSTMQAPFAAALNLGEDWAVGIGEMPAFNSGASFSADDPFAPTFRKFEFLVREWRAAGACRVSDEFNVGLALRLMEANYSLGYTEYGVPPVFPEILTSGAYAGNMDALGLELSALWKAKRFTLGMILRPEVKFDFGHDDFAVEFTPLNAPDVATEAILRTYFPGGGVKTEAVLPLEARVAVTFFPTGPWRFSGEIGWVQWSKWETVTLDYANETVDPGTGSPILSDTQFDTQFNDAFTLTGLAAFTFENAVESYGRLAWQEAICDEPYGATLRPNAGAIITIGGKYPWKFEEFTLAVDAFYTFGVYSSNSGFEMSRNLLGAGLSVAY